MYSDKELYAVCAYNALVPIEFDQLGMDKYVSSPCMFLLLLLFKLVV